MNIIQSNVKTMSSREISELTGSTHEAVKKSAARLSAANLITSPLADTPYTAANKQTYYEFHFNKRDSLVLVARLSPEFTAVVVDRWQELESAVENPAVALPDFSDPVAAARAWADAKESEQAALLQIEQAKPALRLESAISNDDGTLSMTEAGKKLQVKPRMFINWLVDKKYIDYSKMPYQRWINQGLLVISTVEKNGKPRSSTRVTGKGFAYFGGKLSELKFKNCQHELFYKNGK